MKRIFLLIVWLVISATESTALQFHAPQFENYSAAKRCSDRPARVNLRSHPKARLYKTVLRDAADKGPDFAGHYRIAQWGCGSSCLSFAIVDACTGRVYFPPKGLATLGVGVGKLSDIDEEPLQYKPDSRLLKVIGYFDFAFAEKLVGCIYYYKWNGQQLRLIHRTRIK